MLKNLMIAVTALAFASAPAIAANTNISAAGGKGLVVVGLNLLEDAQIDVLRNANIEVLNDNTVQVPINVAAVLCNTEVNVIASGNQQGNKTCDATLEGVDAFAAQ